MGCYLKWVVKGGALIKKHLGGELEEVKMRSFIADPCTSLYTIVLAVLHTSLRAQSALCIHGFHIQGFNQMRIENIQKKFQKIPKKQNLDLPCTRNYLHSIYILLTTT